MEPDWDDFRMLVALARGGSVAGAARELKVDHSTVSRRLAALEEALGATLVVRSSKDLTWTAEGQRALKCAQAVELHVLETTRAIRTAKLEVAGSVRVTCPPGIVAPLVRLLPEAHARRSELSLEITGDNRAVDLARGDADIALRMFRPTEPGLVCRRAFELGWGAYASNAYVAEHGVPKSIDDLPNHHLVLYVEAMHRVPGPRWIEDHRGAASALTRVDNTEAAAHVIASGVGIGVIPCVVADARPDLVRVFAEPVAMATGWIVYHEASRGTARVRAAVDALAELFDAHQALFTGRPGGSTGGQSGPT